MIDRSHLHFCLRPRVLLGALGISIALFVVLPALSLLLVLLGALSFCVCCLLLALMGLLSYGCLIVGGFAAVGGVFSLKDNEKEGGAALGAGIIGLVVGGFCYWLFEGRYSPVWWAAGASFGSCLQGASFVYLELWHGYQVYLWAWLVVTAALIAAALVLLAIGLLTLETPFKYTLLKVGYACPECHHRAVPLFRCPGCSELISDLWPTLYGVWTAPCRCGVRMRTTDLGGRLLRYEKVCRNPACKRDLKDKALGRSSEFHFAVVGAVSSGKSNLMITGVWQLEEFAPSNGLDVNFTNPEEEQAYRGCIARFLEGRFLEKTGAGVIPKAFNVSVRSPSTTTLLYLYDAAGEDFEAGEVRLLSHSFHDYIDGILFVVDPFAEPDLHRGQSREQVKRSFPASTDAADILGRLIPFWESILRVPPHGQFPIPLALVVTKMDACGLEQRLAPAFNPNKRCAHLEEAVEQAEGNSAEVRRFLIEGGLANFVAMVEARFPRVAFFGVSALGRVPDQANHSPYRPRGALAPLLWLAYQSSALHGSFGLAQMVRNLALALRRGLRGSEGSGVQMSLWGLLLASTCAALFGLAWFVGLAWTFGLMAAAGMGMTALSRYRANGLQDVVDLRRRLFRSRLRLVGTLHGEAGRTRQKLAWIFLGGVPVFLIALVWLWWPGALVLSLALLVVFLISLWDG
jgi:hypothetical protein